MTDTLGLGSGAWSPVEDQHVIGRPGKMDIITDVQRIDGIARIVLYDNSQSHGVLRLHEYMAAVAVIGPVDDAPACRDLAVDIRFFSWRSEFSPA